MRNVVLFLLLEIHFEFLLNFDVRIIERFIIV